MIQSGPSGRRWLLVISVLGMVTITLLIVFGRGVLAFSARQLAARQMNRWAISAAQEWLARAAWCNRDDCNVALMRAACYRRLGQMDRWKTALEEAQRAGAPAEEVQQEKDLGRMQLGDLREGGMARLEAMVGAGVPADEVAAAFVYGCLARGETDQAQALLRGWESDYPEEAHVDFMWGVYWRQSGDLDRAAAKFQEALARQPRHEPARNAVAEVFEAQDYLDRAFDQYVDLATRFPGSEAGVVGLARLLRKSDRIDEARKILRSLATQPAPAPSIAVEMGQIELVAGNYEQADRWFAKARLDPADDTDAFTAAATALALDGQPQGAERLLAVSDTAQSASRRIYDLRVRLVINQADREALDELQRLSASMAAGADGTVTWPTAADEVDSRTASGPELYALYCAQCHGDNGDGHGRAARHLFPRPRDLRGGKFRLVRTRNAVPTFEDIEEVIRLGVPGTSMPSYEDLTKSLSKNRRGPDRSVESSEQDVPVPLSPDALRTRARDQTKLLTEEVLRLHREGVRQQFTDALLEQDGQIDEVLLGEVVEDCTTPGEVIDVPAFGPSTPEAIDRGKSTYLELGCNKCHGDDGAGAWDMVVFDDRGRATRPRDLVHEPLKGGPGRESMYLRIAVGMPGSPHPSAGGIADEQLVDLVHFCRSLSQEPKRHLTSHQQAILATCRDYLSAFGR